MNKERRKRISEADLLLEQAKALLEQAKEIVEEVKGEEQDSFDNLTEGLQASDRGQTMQAAIDALESAYDGLDSLDLDSVTCNLEEARGG